MSHDLTLSIKAEAYRLGFDLCRITPVKEAPHADFFEAWLALDRTGEMHYLARNTEKRRDPALLADNTVDNTRADNTRADNSGDKTGDNIGHGGFHSMIVLAVNHYQFPLSAEIMADPSRGIIASYAWGDDYHEIIRPALYALDGFIRSQTARATPGKCLVDTGPVLERDWAHRIGLGFTGKNCCTIHPRLGSWLLLATILVPEKLTADAPLKSVNPLNLPLSSTTPEAVADGLPPAQEYGRWEMPLNDISSNAASSVAKDNVSTQIVTCGRCTRCIDDCPTQAFVGPYHLNPQRCISYWTIEAHAPIPRKLRTHFGNRIFGCDICQEICPWNHRLDQRTPIMAGLIAQAERIAPPLLEGFAPETPYWLNQAAFSTRFRRSPIKRAKRVGMLRNVCVALGNWADPVVVQPLMLALGDPDPIPRGHAAWALGQVLKQHSLQIIHDVLDKALAKESVGWVREEIQHALGTIS